MPEIPPPGQQRIIPYLAYRDAPAALEFLDKAFGFRERFRYPMPDGKIGHAEMAFAGNVVMLASVWEEGGMASPRELPAVHGQVFCWVDDVDAHHARARAAGATIVAEPADQPYGERTYRALDPEGHRWIFASPLP
jgi:PhnB protein